MDSLVCQLLTSILHEDKRSICELQDSLQQFQELLGSIDKKQAPGTCSCVPLSGSLDLQDAPSGRQAQNDRLEQSNSFSIFTSKEIRISRI